MIVKKELVVLLVLWAAIGSPQYKTHAQPWFMVVEAGPAKPKLHVEARPSPLHPLMVVEGSTGSNWAIKVGRHLPKHTWVFASYEYLSLRDVLGFRGAAQDTSGTRTIEFQRTIGSGFLNGFVGAAGIGKGLPLGQSRWMAIVEASAVYGYHGGRGALAGADIGIPAADLEGRFLVSSNTPNRHFGLLRLGLGLGYQMKKGGMFSLKGLGSLGLVPVHQYGSTQFSITQNGVRHSHQVQAWSKGTSAALLLGYTFPLRTKKRADDAE